MAVEWAIYTYCCGFYAERGFVSPSKLSSRGRSTLQSLGDCAIFRKCFLPLVPLNRSQYEVGEGVSYHVTASIYIYHQFLLLDAEETKWIKLARLCWCIDCSKCSWRSSPARGLWERANFPPRRLAVIEHPSHLLIQSMPRQFSSLYSGSFWDDTVRIFCGDFRMFTQLVSLCMCSSFFFPFSLRKNWNHDRGIWYMQLDGTSWHFLVVFTDFHGGLRISERN